MNLLVLPDDGLAAVTGAIRKARKSVRMTIFRCDLREVEKAMADAVARGVAVHALIAHTNRAGEKKLRELELRLLAAGVTVSRTSDDLARYHDKLLVVDERVLFVLGFNFTRADVGKRRSMAVATRKRKLVAEAVKLFDADATRQPFTSSVADLVISPLNARARLARLIKAAKRSLWIYDPGAIDAPLLKLVRQRAENMKADNSPQDGLEDVGVKVARVLVPEIVRSGAGNRHGNKKDVKDPFGNLSNQLEQRWLLSWRNRHALDTSEQKASCDKNENRNAGIGMDVGACHLVGARRTGLFDAPVPCIHAVRKEQVEKDGSRCEPVQDALRQGKGERCGRSHGRGWPCFV